MSKRIETGPTEVPGDWPGVFIRGDHCAHYGMTLRRVLELMETSQEAPDAVTRAVLEGLCRTLESSYHARDTQKIKLLEGTADEDGARTS